MNTYPSYKDSGVEWIGEIPSGWDSVKLKYIFHEKPITHNVELNCGSISFGRVVFKDNDKVPISTKNSYQEVLKGEYLINPLNLNYDLKSLRIGLSDIDVVVSSGYIVIKNRIEISKPYYKWLLHIYDILHMKLLGSGVRQTISFNHISNSILTYPPFQEQQQISDYLNYKTSKIDTLIEKTKQKIELLKEQRTSFINTTVTKGLNPNVEMKDSGVEWIGDVPSSWNVIRLVNLGVFSKGKGIVKDDIKSEGHPCVRGGEVYTQYNRIFNRTVSYISDDTIEKTVLVKYKSILFSGDGETLEEIGKCIVYNGSEDIYIGGGINVFTPIDTVNHIFLSYSLNSEYVVFQKSREGRGQIVVHIYQKQLREIRLSIPPLQEQQQIVDYLDKETSIIDILITKESKRIELLKEYRQSLISDVVTGKVDVRNEVLA